MPAGPAAKQQKPWHSWYPCHSKGTRDGWGTWTSARPWRQFPPAMHWNPSGKQERWWHPNLCWPFPAETESSWGQTLLRNTHQRPAAEELRDVKVTSREIHTLHAQLWGRQLTVHYLAHQQSFSPLWNSFNGTGEMCPFLKVPVWGPSWRRRSWWVWNSPGRENQLSCPAKVLYPLGQCKTEVLIKAYFKPFPCWTSN